MSTAIKIPVALGTREQSWYLLEPMDEAFTLDNDSKVTVDQIIRSYQQLQICIQSANKSKLSGIENLKFSVDQALHKFLGSNAVRIRKV